MSLSYEWLCETVAGAQHEVTADSEIINHSHADTYAEALTFAQPDGMNHDRIVLVRDDTARAWAYLEDGRLPTHFSDAWGHPGVIVPKRFHKEVAKGGAS